MKAFPKSSPRKEIKVNLMVRRPDGENKVTEYSAKAYQVGCLVVHKVLDDVEQGLFHSKEYQITHLFTGYSIGVSGTYRYCSLVANECLKEPVLWMINHEMMKDHPDYNDFMGRFQEIKHCAGRIIAQERYDRKFGKK